MPNQFENPDLHDDVSTTASFNLNDLQNSKIGFDNTVINEESILNFILRRHLKYKDKYLIPEYQCNQIFEDIKTIIRYNTQLTVSFIRATQQQYANSKADIIPIICNYLETNNNIYNLLNEKIGNKGKYIFYLDQNNLKKFNFILLLSPSRLD